MKCLFLVLDFVKYISKKIWLTVRLKCFFFSFMNHFFFDWYDLYSRAIYSPKNLVIKKAYPFFFVFFSQTTFQT